MRGSLCDTFFALETWTADIAVKRGGKAWECIAHNSYVVGLLQDSGYWLVVSRGCMKLARWL